MSLNSNNGILLTRKRTAMPPLGTPGNQLPATNPAERVSADTRTSADTFSVASRSADVASSTKQFAAKGAKVRIASTTGVSVSYTHLTLPTTPYV